MKFVVRVCLPVVAAALSALLPVPLSAGDLRVVSLTGNRAPGTPAGVAYSSLGPPQINQRGQVAFISHLTGPGVVAENDSGVWSGSPSSLSLVTREGDPLTVRDIPAPVHLRRFEDIWFNGAGHTLVRGSFQASVISPQFNYWSDTSGQISYITRAPGPAPGAGTGVNFSSAGNALEYAHFNDAGQMTFRVALSGTGVNTSNDGSFWFYNGTNVDMIARESGPVPSVPNRVFHEIPTNTATALNNAGHFAFVASTRPSGGGSTSISLWTNRSGTLQSVAGISGGSIDSVVINSVDRIAYREVDTAANPDRSTIRAENQFGFRTVATSNQLAPGISGDVRFTTFRQLALNDASQVAFVGELQGVGVTQHNDDGIWAEGPGGLQLVVRTGDAVASHAGSPLYLKSLPGISPQFSLNARGQVAFIGKLAFRPDESEYGDGLFARDLDGTLRLIARTGMEIDVQNGPGVDMRQIISVGALLTGGNGDGRPSAFSDRGQLAFRAAFSDGTSAVLLSNMVATVPEPTCSCLALVALLMLTRFHRIRGKTAPTKFNLIGS